MIAPARRDDQALWQQHKTDPGNVELRNRLVEHFLPLVDRIVTFLLPRMHDHVEDDVRQAGVLGLIDAIGSFDPSLGVRFETHGKPRIRGAMLDELRKLDWTPRRMRSRVKQLRKAVTELEAETGRHPSHEKLADHMELSLLDVKKASREAVTISRVALADLQEDGALLADPEQEAPAERLERADLVEFLTQGLDEREQSILAKYYWDGLSQKEVGEATGVSRGRIGQIHSDIVQRLRSQLAESTDHKPKPADSRIE